MRIRNRVLRPWHRPWLWLLVGLGAATGVYAGCRGRPTAALSSVDLGPLSLHFEPLTLGAALQLGDAAAALGPLCAPLPPPLTAPNAQAPSPLRERSSINLGERLAAYLGDLHSHTALSDADEGTPETAYRFARDVAKLDFFAVTDHPEYWLLTQADHYARQKVVAAAEARPGFVPLYGFEYSSTIHGHFVVLNSEHVRNSFQDATLAAFYAWLAAPAQRDALAIFAHPGFHLYRHAVEFDHFAPAPAANAQLIGLEVIHWDGYRRGLIGYGGDLPFLDEALLAGWRVGAIASEDNHAPNWGTRDTSRIGLLLPRLGKAEVLAALRARRFYATTNKDLQFAVDAQRRDGSWAPMGAALRPAELDPGGAPVKVRYYDRACSAWPRRLEAVVNGRVAGVYHFPGPAATGGAAFPAAGELTLTLPWARAAGRRLYLYFRFVQGDDEETFTESSPLFFDLDAT